MKHLGIPISLAVFLALLLAAGSILDSRAGSTPSNPSPSQTHSTHRFTVHLPPGLIPRIFIVAAVIELEISRPREPDQTSPRGNRLMSWLEQLEVWGGQFSHVHPSQSEANAPLSRLSPPPDTFETGRVVRVTVSDIPWVPRIFTKRTREQDTTRRIHLRR
jgi:hypothetical protein